MTFDEGLELLEGWTGRRVSVAVRTTRDDESAPVAVFRGRLGKAEMDAGQGEARRAAFFPVEVGGGRALDRTMGLHLSAAEFEDAWSESGRLFVMLRGAAIEVAPE